MVCICCDHSYCHHAPCAKYTRVRASWAGLTTESPVNLLGFIGQPAGMANRFDGGCSYPAGNLPDGGFDAYNSFAGMSFGLYLGNLRAGGGALPFPHLVDSPKCVASTTQADDFTISGIVNVQLIAEEFSFRAGFTHFIVSYSYTINKDGNVNVARLGNIQIADYFIDRGIVRPFCRDFVNANNAFAFVEPVITPIQTSTGRQCGAGAIDFRGFPAHSGPYRPSSLCAASCTNLLP